MKKLLIMTCAMCVLAGSAFAGEEAVDAKGARVYPGFIDAHSHLGLFDDGLTDEGSDGNEIVSPVSPDLRAIDGMHNADPCFKEARDGGVVLVAAGGKRSDHHDCQKQRDQFFHFICLISKLPIGFADSPRSFEQFGV